MGSSPTRALASTVGRDSSFAHAPGQVGIGREFDSHPCPQHVESGFQHVMRLNLGQVERVLLCPLKKTVTGHHTQTVLLGRLGVMRAAGVDNRWEAP